MAYTEGLAAQAQRVEYGQDIARDPAGHRLGELSSRERALLVGTYRMGRISVEILESAGALKLRQGGQAEVDVRLVGEDRIALLLPGGGRQVIIVVRDADGRAAYLNQGMRSLARQP